MLDDVDLDREDLEALRGAVPQSVFVFGSLERSLWGDGKAITLRGLDDDAALALIEQHLERPLVGDERSDFAALCRALDGHPLQLVKAAAHVREHGTPPRELTRAHTGHGALARGPAAQTLTARVVGELSAEARRTLMLLAALNGAPLHVDAVAALTGQSDSARRLAELEQRGLAESHSPRYSAAASLGALQPTDAVAHWRAELLSYFVAHAERHETRPELLRDDLEPIIQTLYGGMPVGRYVDVLRLARAAEGAAALAGLWDAWRTILETALDAARRTGDEASEAWALHQLGTRALCLDDEQEARRQLSEALGLRERIGDEVGATVTRHNIGHLPGPPPPPPPDGSPGPSGPSGPSGAPYWMAPACAGVVAKLGVVAVVPFTGDEGPDRDGRGAPVIDRRADPRPPAPRPPSPRARTDPSDTRSQDARTPVLRTAASSIATPPDAPAPTGASPSAGGTAPAIPPMPRPPELPPDNPPREPPSPSTPPGPSTPPAPNPPSDMRPASCRSGLIEILRRLIEDEIVVVRKVLDIDVPGVLEAQIEAVRNLLLGLGHRCTRTETAALLRAAT